MAVARFPWIAVGLVLMAIAVQVSSELTSWFAFDVNASLRGQIWRPLTGHLCHYNRSHFVGDVAAFLVWASVIELQSRRLLGAALIGTPLAVAGWLFCVRAEPLMYRGLSAIDCALAAQLFTVVFLSETAQRTPWLRVALVGTGAVMLLKSSYEFATGHAVLATNLGRHVRLLPEAHVLGVLVGVATAWWRQRCGSIGCAQCPNAQVQRSAWFFTSSTSASIASKAAESCCGSWATRACKSVQARSRRRMASLIPFSRDTTSTLPT